MSKIVMIGAGSVCFGAGIIGDLIHYREELEGATISLVDIDKEKLGLMKNLSDIMNKNAVCLLKLKQVQSVVMF